MAKQPVNGCVSNHSHSCGKKLERKIRINLKAPEETSMFLENIKNINKFFVSFPVSTLTGLLGFPVYATHSSTFDAGFSVFYFVNFANLFGFVGIYLSSILLL